MILPRTSGTFGCCGTMRSIALFAATAEATEEAVLDALAAGRPLAGATGRDPAGVPARGGGRAGCAEVTPGDPHEAERGPRTQRRSPDDFEDRHLVGEADH